MEFIITGTQAYGPTNPNSDLDIVLKTEGVKLLRAYLKAHNIETYRTESQVEYEKNTGDGGFYFGLSGIQVNIISVLSENEFQEWRVRTEKMKMLLPIEDKQERIDVFNTLEVKL